MQQFLFYLLWGFFLPFKFFNERKKKYFFFLFGKDVWQGIYFQKWIKFLTYKQLLIDLIHIEILRSK